MVERLPPFTPMMDCILRCEEVSRRDTMVFGVVWRYANGNFVFDKSKQFIANVLHVSVWTPKVAIKHLCKIGFLEDLTPNFTNKPHKYLITPQVLAIIQNYLVEKLPAELRIRKRLPDISLAEAIKTSILMAEIEADKLKPQDGFSVEQLEFIAIAKALREFIES